MLCKAAAKSQAVVIATPRSTEAWPSKPQVGPRTTSRCRPVFQIGSHLKTNQAKSMFSQSAHKIDRKLKKFKSSYIFLKLFHRVFQKRNKAFSPFDSVPKELMRHLTIRADVSNLEESENPVMITRVLWPRGIGTPIGSEVAENQLERSVELCLAHEKKALRKCSNEKVH